MIEEAILWRKLNVFLAFLTALFYRRQTGDTSLESLYSLYIVQILAYIM